jgi:hypothetical protein
VDERSKNIVSNNTSVVSSTLVATGSFCASLLLFTVLVSNAERISYLEDISIYKKWTLDEKIQFLLHLLFYIAL